jgi:hypothetical protein
VIDPAPLVLTPIEEPETGNSDQTIVQSLKSAANLFAPATLLTGLLLYAGWIRTRAFFTYFGVNSSILAFGPQDYVLRSADVGLGAVVFLAFTGGSLIVLDRILSYTLKRIDQRPSARWFRLTLAVVGGALMLFGLSSVTTFAALVTVSPIASSGLIASGAVLFLRFGAATGARPGLFGPATNAFGLLVLAVSAFWATNAYAESYGIAAAVSIDRDPSRLAIVTVFSKDPIDLAGGNVGPPQVVTQGGTTFYRYTGAQLLTYANERWLLITNPPTPDYHSTVVVLRDSDSLRVETSVPR